MSESRLEAVLWDMDGVIADTADYHYGAWRDVFRERGVAFSKTDFMRHFGQRHDTIIKFALGDKLTPEEIEAIADKKQALYRERVSKNVVPLPGAIELIELLKKNRIKTAIATSAVPKNIDVILEGLGIQDSFQTIAFGTEVSEGKPSPQVFQLAAKRLGVRPADCVVIEDAIAGVAAAKRAGMKCVAVTNSHPGRDLQNADFIVDTLEKVDINVLRSLFNNS
ncbi:MAG: HAD family phosphatase [Dehalococcoidales bacterium]|nr:HAD family phosphatase [Dehalococcoidales bacterium]